MYFTYLCAAVALATAAELSVLQRFAGCCSGITGHFRYMTLHYTQQHTATLCKIAKSWCCRCITMHCNTLPHTVLQAGAGTTPQATATYGVTVQPTATHGNMQYHKLVLEQHFNTLQHTATHRNTLQNTLPHAGAAVAAGCARYMYISLCMHRYTHMNTGIHARDNEHADRQL